MEPLKSEKVAECCAAFLFNYVYEHSEIYIRLKEMMAKVLKKKLVHGETFVNTDEDDKKEILDVLIGLSDEDALTKIRVKKFIRKSGQ